MQGPQAATAAAVAPSGRAWIQGQRWDLGWLIGSAIIVPAVLIAVWAGAGSMEINLGVTAIIGGPHLFSTYLATFGDARFRRRHMPLLAAVSLAVPALVVWGTLTNFQVLLSIFIFTASFHVLHQNAYLTDIYRRRSGLPEWRSARWIDYGLLLLCIYPIASWKLVHSDFYLGEVEILLPPFLKIPATYYAVWAAFAFFLILWTCKTVWEWRRGLLNRPKTLLIAITTVIAFFVPAAATGPRLELAFQSVNAWHSIQYLGIVWFILRMRKARGELGDGLVKRLAGQGRASFYFYGFCFAVTLALLGTLITLASADPWGLNFDQYYYMGVLSALLVHYVLDAYLFTVSNLQGTRPEEIPFAIPAAA